MSDKDSDSDPVKQMRARIPNIDELLADARKRHAAAEGAMRDEAEARAREHDKILVKSAEAGFYRFVK